VSDGGDHNYQSNYGDLIAAKSYSLATNMGKLYNVPFCESSYQSELFGMLADTISLQHNKRIQNQHSKKNKKIYFCCDNKSVVKMVNSRINLRRTVNQHRYPDVDIGQQLLYKLKTLDEMQCAIGILNYAGSNNTHIEQSILKEKI
jgi:hypothetical protein